MNPRTLRLSLLLAFAAGCGPGDEAATTDPPTDASTSNDASSGDASTDACWQAAAIPSDLAALGDADGAAGDYATPTVAGACVGTSFELTSNGIPTYEFVAITPNALTTQSHAYFIPRTPSRAATVSGVPLGGAIGVTVTGLPIFGPTEAPADGYRDPVLDALLDDCGGHTAPGGVYHMHGRPSCLVAQLGGERHGLIVGFAWDGYPIVAPTICTNAACTTTETATSSWRLRDGAYDDAATASWTAYEYVEGLGNLDLCNGAAIDASESPYDYAYFATEGFPYYVGCYRGTVDARNVVGAATSANLIDYANGGAVIPGGGTGGATTCTVDAECTATCATASCVCASTPMGMNVCASSCAGGATCPVGTNCVQNVCRPAL